MFITNQYSISVTLNDVGATNDVNAVTGIAAGGPYNGAVIAIVGASGAPTAIAVGDGVMPLVTTQATVIPFNVVRNYYIIDLNGAVVVGGRPHVMKLTHFNLHISEFEYVLDYKLTIAETTATNDLLVTTNILLCNYDRSSLCFYITIPDATVATYANTKNLILSVDFSRNN